MRIWHIHPSYLDSKRLLAQNNESHGILTCIRKGTPWGSITKDFREHMDYLKEVHDEVAWEIETRKSPGISFKRAIFLHKSKMDISDLDEIHKSSKFRPTKALVQKDIEELRMKWETELYYFGVGREDLRELERDYKLKQGPNEDLIHALRQLAKAIHIKEKDFFKKQKGTFGIRLQALMKVKPIYEEQAQSIRREHGCQ